MTLARPSVYTSSQSLDRSDTCGLGLLHTADMGLDCHSYDVLSLCTAVYADDAV